MQTNYLTQKGMEWGLRFSIYNKFLDAASLQWHSKGVASTKEPNSWFYRHEVDDPSDHNPFPEKGFSSNS